MRKLSDLIIRLAMLLPEDRETQDQALFAVGIVATVVSIISGCRP